MNGKLVVGHVAELVVELREKKLNINDKTVTDTSDSMFLLKLMDFSERKPLARRGAKGKYPPGPLLKKKIKTNLLDEEYTAKCKAGEQR